MSAHSLTFLCALYPGSGDFTRIFLSKREPCASPSLFYTRASHNLGKALGEGLGLLCAPFILLDPFHLSIPFTSLSLSPLYPFHLSIPFTSLSLSLSLSLISPSLSKSLLLPFFLSLSSLYHSLWRI